MTKAREMEGMARQLSESNAHLDALQRQAKTRLENRSRFFAETTHDFKQRLHGAKLMILSAKALVADDRAARHVHRLAEEMDQLEQYMMGILSSARSEALGRAPPDVATVPLQAVFQQLDLQYEELAAQTRKILRFRNTPFRVWSDRAMLERVLGNLVSNALKFTRSSVLVAARRRGAALVIEVWDQGPGIAADAHHRIFEAYQQESGAEDLQSGGVGLGLAVVKRLTHMLGYTVSLHSRLGAGSVFRITSPEHLVIAE
jgi:signal transduction histidine kinase